MRIMKQSSLVSRFVKPLLIFVPNPVISSAVVTEVVAFALIHPTGLFCSTRRLLRNDTDAICCHLMQYHVLHSNFEY